jgi:hypothetical protein
MARRDPAGIRLLIRNGHDWSPSYPLIVKAVNRLKVRSCLMAKPLPAMMADFQPFNCSVARPGQPANDWPGLATTTKRTGWGVSLRNVPTFVGQGGSAQKRRR